MSMLSKELKFPTYKVAKIEAIKFKKMYGYKPEIFEILSPRKKRSFVIVKPYGLKKLN